MILCFYVTYLLHHPSSSVKKPIFFCVKKQANKNKQEEALQTSLALSMFQTVTFPSNWF